jgi:hypothetical protein
MYNYKKLENIDKQYEICMNVINKMQSFFSVLDVKYQHPTKLNEAGY